MINYEGVMFLSEVFVDDCVVIVGCLSYFFVLVDFDDIECVLLDVEIFFV